MKTKARHNLFQEISYVDYTFLSIVIRKNYYFQFSVGLKAINWIFFVFFLHLVPINFVSAYLGLFVSPSFISYLSCDTFFHKRTNWYNQHIGLDIIFHYRIW